MKGKRSRFPAATDGDRIAPVMKGYKLACCDCGLVHTLNFEVVLGANHKPGGTWESAAPPKGKTLRVVFEATRDRKATANLRRRKAGHPMVPAQ